MNYQYVKVKLQLSGHTKILWAEKRIREKGLVQYTKCSRSGETNPNGKIDTFLADPIDVLWEKPAKMNNFYGELEIPND